MQLELPSTYNGKTESPKRLNNNVYNMAHKGGFVVKVKNNFLYRVWSKGGFVFHYANINIHMLNSSIITLLLCYSIH